MSRIPSRDAWTGDATQCDAVRAFANALDYSAGTADSDPEAWTQDEVQDFEAARLDEGGLHPEVRDLLEAEILHHTTKAVRLAKVSRDVSAAFRAAFEAHPQRGEDPSLALDSAREAADALVPSGVWGDFDDERLTFSADGCES